MVIKNVVYYLIGCINRVKFCSLSTKRNIREHHQKLGFVKLCRLFPLWLNSLDMNNKGTLVDQLPWLAFEAIEFIKQIMTEDMRVYEYGSGGSTLFFAKQTKEVVSVEHDRLWYNRVSGEIQNRGYRNCKIRLCEPEPDREFSERSIADPEAYISDDFRYRGMVFRKYASSIDSYPEQYFDIILIDGRARPSCFKHAKNKVKKEGFLILDDADRNYYSYVIDILRDQGWEKFIFYGPSPYIRHFKETCIFKRLSI